MKYRITRAIVGEHGVVHQASETPVELSDEVARAAGPRVEPVQEVGFSPPIDRELRPNEFTTKHHHRTMKREENSDG